MNPKLDRRPLGLFLLLITIIYWSSAVRICFDRALWFDEIFTYFVASQDSLTMLLSSLRDGMDNQPPFDAVLRHFSMWVFGEGELAFRVPSMIAIYLSFLLLVWLGTQIHSDLAGMLAGTLLFLSDGFNYFTEGRPYPVVIALTALCCVLWRLLVNRDYKPLYLWALIGFALGCAITSHYYTIALAAAVGFASIAACLRQRRILPGIGVMAAVVAGFALWVLPYATTAKAAMGNSFHSPAPSFPAVARITLFQFSSYGFWLVTILAIAVLVFPRTSREDQVRLAFTEVILLVTIMLSPLIHYLLANFYTNAYISRYSLFALVGGCIVVASFLAKPMSESLRLRFALAFCSVLLVFFQFRYIKAVSTEVHSMRKLVAEIAKAGEGDLVIPTPKDYLQLFYYADAKTKERLVFLYDDFEEMRRFKSTTLSKSLRLLGQHVPLVVKEYRAYIQSHKQIVIIKPRDRDFLWLDDRLKADGFTLTQAAGDHDQVLFLANRTETLQTR